MYEIKVNNVVIEADGTADLVNFTKLFLRHGYTVTIREFKDDEETQAKEEKS